MKEKNSRGKYTVYLLGGILLLSFFFRFYNFHNLLFFGMDQEYEAFIVKNIVSLRHFPLIGVNASDTGLYLGPAFIYFAAIPFALFGGNPIGWGITASLLGVFTTYLIYWVGRRIFSTRVGLIASFFYASSFMVSYYDRNFWNPTPIAFLSVVVGYLLIKLSHNIGRYLPLLALAFGIGIQSHLSFFVFTPFILYVLWRESKHIPRKILLASLGLFLLLQLPLILFDVRHNFTNSRALVQLFHPSTNSISSLGERVNLFVSALAKFVWVPASSDMFVSIGQCQELSSAQKAPPPEAVILSLTLLGAFLWVIFQKRKSKLHDVYSKLEQSSCVHVYRIFLLTIIVILIFTRRFSEYYFLYFFPYVAFIFAIVLDYVWKRKGGKIAGLVFLLVFGMLNFISLLTAYSSYSYRDKIEALTYAKEYIGSNSYSLEALGECPRFGGYRYLADYIIGPPNSSYMDSYFSWLYPDSIRSEIPRYTVLLSLIDPRSEKGIVSAWQEKKYEYLAKYNIVSQKQFRTIRLLILTPKSS